MSKWGSLDDLLRLKACQIVAKARGVKLQDAHLQLMRNQIGIAGSYGRFERFRNARERLPKFISGEISRK